MTDQTLPQLIVAIASEHPGPIAVGLVAIGVWLLHRLGALPRFTTTPAVTPRTPEQAANDARRACELRLAAARIAREYDDEDRPRVVHPIVTFEKERAQLSDTQRRIRLAARQGRA